MKQNVMWLCGLLLFSACEEVQSATLGASFPDAGRAPVADTRDDDDDDRENDDEQRADAALPGSADASTALDGGDAGANVVSTDGGLDGAVGRDAGQDGAVYTDASARDAGDGAVDPLCLLEPNEPWHCKSRNSTQP